MLYALCVFQFVLTCLKSALEFLTISCNEAEYNCSLVVSKFLSDEKYISLSDPAPKETAKVTDFSKGFRCFLFRKIPLHRTYILNHRENNCSTN